MDVLWWGMATHSPPVCHGLPACSTRNLDALLPQVADQQGFFMRMHEFKAAARVIEEGYNWKDRCGADAATVSHIRGRVVHADGAPSPCFLSRPCLSSATST